MGRTVLCPHCKSTFDEDVLKMRGSTDVCLVCGKSLLSGSNSGRSKNMSFGNGVKLGEFDSFDEDKIDFWWYSIREPGTMGEKDRGNVGITCTSCGHLSGTSYPIAKAGNYILLDPRSYAACSNCKKELKNHILSKRPANWEDPRKREMWVKDYLNMPKCPTCSSTNIKKISTASKVGSVAMWGILSRKVHKQWHCNTCGIEW